jgi:putative ABC transport system permease protein
VLKILLGWLQLKKEPLRFAVALTGVGFAVVLMLMQLGFRESLFESSVRYHENFRYDVALVSAETSFIAQPRPFADRRLFQALAIPGVAAVTPVYLALGLWKNLETHETRSIFVVGFPPVSDPLNVHAISAQLDRIKLEDVLLFDQDSRPEYGPIAQRFRSGDAVSVELNHRNVEIGGLFELGTSFGIDGSVVTSDSNFLRLFPQRDRGLIDVGLVQLAEGVDGMRVREALRAQLPGDVEVLTKPEFVSREKHYWDATTPIGYVFAFGTIVGVVIGGIIVYQILFADVSDHLAEYATLKAIGYSEVSISSVVVQQAVILAVLGYLPGFVLCLWLYRTAGLATRLPLHMTLSRALVVFLLTIAMCSASALTALRKLRSADPAEIF